MSELIEIEKKEVKPTEKNTPLSFDISKFQEFKIQSEPSHGKISIGNKSAIYQPDNDFVGTDLVTYSSKSSGGKKETGLIVFNVTENFFKPRARLLLQLGDQLIRNESIALVELVKNSYDADSSFAKVTMQNVDDLKNGIIIIEDDGHGMDVDTIRNSWLEPGSDNKAKQVDEKKLTPKFKRLPIGEKGIGRFGVHKLGNHIELITRQKDKKEVAVTIDWEDFAKHKYLNEAPVKIEERYPEVFKGNKTGTKITITRLRKAWERGMVRDVKRAIDAIATPPTYKIRKDGTIEDSEASSFKPEFIINNTEWLKGIPDWKEIREYALFFFDIEIEGDKIKKFTYIFRPWDVMSKLENRKVTEKDKPISQLLDLLDPFDQKKVNFLNLNDYNIGKIELSGYIFIRDRQILKLALNQPSFIGEYLDHNGGIRVYRDGMRIYDYGEPENDWLELDYRRFNNPSFDISNNMIIASVNLARNQSKDLVEKTNREGFVENKAYQVFKLAIIYALKNISILRREDKNKVDALYKNATQKFEPVQHSIDDLKSVVKEKVKNKDLKKELGLYIDKVEKNYRFMNETLIKSASAGLGWSIYIHEIEKILAEINKVLIKGKGYDRALKLFKHLSEIIESYAQILRKGNRKVEDLKNIIEQALFNMEFRFAAHNIQIEKSYKNFKGETHINIARNLVVGSLMNIIDNSIYWLERGGKKQKKIYLNISKEDKGYLSIVIADNGPGFALPTEEITEPFVSAKPDGMGLGLHLAREIMLGHKGKILFNESREFYIPKEFESGAIVALCFKK